MTQLLITGLILSIVFSLSYSFDHQGVHEELADKIAGIVNSMKEKRQTVLGQDSTLIQGDLFSFTFSNNYNYVFIS